MNITDITSNAELVYKTQTKWSFKSFGCDVSYYEETPLDDLSFVICSILQTNDGEYSKWSLGMLLGFAMRDRDDEGHGTRTYYDKSEEKLFDDILGLVESHHLITIVEDHIFITPLGEISLAEGNLYTFYKSRQYLYEHLNLFSSHEEDMKMFPFFKDLGIYTVMQPGIQYWPEDNQVEDIIYGQKSQMCVRLDNISRESNNIFDAVQDKLFDIVTHPVNINLYCQNGEYIPIVFNNECPAEKATELLHETRNTDKRENIIRECLFTKLWNDRSAAFTYSTLSPYLDLINLEELSCDSRMDWADVHLFDYIVSNATGKTWKNISRFCDINILKASIDKLRGDLDWGVLSDRVDDEFLVENFLNYPWDLEEILKSGNHKLETIENLLLKEKEGPEDWDWNFLETYLPRDFVCEHLDKLDVDMRSYTEESPEICDKILACPHKKWDWDKIENDFSLDFILSHFGLLHEYFLMEPLLDRVFTDEQWSKRFIHASEFCDVLREDVSSKKKLNSFVANNKSYCWDLPTLKLFDELELITWGDKQVAGIETNENITWDKDTFASYYMKVKSQAGFTQVSKSITTPSVVLDTLCFNWDWDVISANVSFINSDEFIKRTAPWLKWDIVVASIPDIELLENLPEISEKLGANEAAWHEFSKRASLSLVTSNCGWNWDWCVLTPRLFTRLKLEKLGHPNFVKKWDWTYLSQNVSDEFLRQNLEKYDKYWDWNVVIPRVVPEDKKFDLGYLDSLADLLTNITGHNSIAAWHALTTYYSFSELKKVFALTQKEKKYWWDFEYFSRHSDFDVLRDLSVLSDWIDWDALSSSEKLAAQITYDKRCGIKQNAWNEQLEKKLFSVPQYEHKWNFKLLSHIEYLCSNETFISRHVSGLDWDYVSQNSKIFCEMDPVKLGDKIDKYKEYISFEKLSSREDVYLTEEIVKKFLKKGWNFNRLLAIGTIHLDSDFILKRHHYFWDWELLSNSEMVTLSNELLLANLDKEWDWRVLSSRKDIKWDDRLLCSVYDKDVDWYMLSSSEEFSLTPRLYELTKGKTLNWENISYSQAAIDNIKYWEGYLDWNAISRNKCLFKDGMKILDEFASRLNWRIICKREDFSIDNIARYSPYINWHIISQREDFVIDNEMIERYGDNLDWQEVSASEHIHFTQELIDKYRDKWDYSVLRQNRAFYNALPMLGKGFMHENNIIKFVEHFRFQPPKIYHFTHLFNAIKIIEKMSLQSRNKANGHFENSAGSNVYITNKAHGFARFYFAPRSPTQFYNECLGKDIGDKNYKDALGLGLPKCPMPVFFVAELSEVLSKYPDKCYYSNGNMQKGSSRYFRVIEDPDRIDGRGVYDPYNKDARQQEFLVEGELPLGELSTLRIYCYDTEQFNILKRAIKGSPLEIHLVEPEQSIYSGLYLRQNKEIVIEENSTQVKISTTDYNGRNYIIGHKFRVDFEPNQGIPKVEGEDIVKKSKSIYTRTYVTVNKGVPFKIYFEVQMPSYRSWKLYES